MNTILSNRTITDRDAVMFDIDDTLIYSNGTPNKPIIKLLQQAMFMGYRIVIITARPCFSEAVTYTENQLDEHGIVYDDLVFTSPENKSIYKKESGLNYVLSVGDLDTDLTDSEYIIKTNPQSFTLCI